MILLVTAFRPASAAVTRLVEISAPATIIAGRAMTVAIFTSTNGGDAEQVGFLQAEYSLDSGKTWVGICYDTMVGATAGREVHLVAGPAGSLVLVRVRVAFRSSHGDVDYAGRPIDWQGTWTKWKKPPAKISLTRVVED